jgi:hypothetical protein
VARLRHDRATSPILDGHAARVNEAAGQLRTRRA